MSNTKTKPATQIDRRPDVKPEAGEHQYGDVAFADPVNNKYPIDTPEHVRAAWISLHHKDNAAKYAPDQVALIKKRIMRAAKNMG